MATNSKPAPLAAKTSAPINHRCETTNPPRRAADLRCHCGRLLAKLTKNGFELKCTRCKRTWRIAASNSFARLEVIEVIRAVSAVKKVVK